MSNSRTLLSRSVLVGVLIVSNAYGASALTVKRTNQLIDGVYAPVLIVKHNGQTTVHMIGKDGLTRSIMFDQGRALAWARQLYGAEATAASNDDDGSDDDDGGYGGSF